MKNPKLPIRGHPNDPGGSGSSKALSRDSGKFFAFFIRNIATVPSRIELRIGGDIFDIDLVMMDGTSEACNFVLPLFLLWSFTTRTLRWVGALLMSIGLRRWLPMMKVEEGS